MSVSEAAWPLLVTLGLFLALSPWISPEAHWVRSVWRLLSLLTLGRYLLWRVLETLPAPEVSARFAYQATCLAIEALFWYLVIGIRRREARRLDRSPEADAHTAWWGERREAPLVDILIPTYNEARPILERTLVGAMHQDYPRYRIWILDDGARDWLRDWAAELGVSYLRRADQRHYKAGNMNAGLAQIRAQGEAAEFVAVIDADFVLKPRFLKRTLALMHDPRTALVQTPQHFFNADPFQHALGGASAVPDEQRYFFDYRLPIMDYAGYGNCCGTSFLVRSSALEQIGGFPTESVSEDTLMSMKLRRLGQRSVYLNEPLSVGLNPDGLKQYLSQRARWSLGLIQIMRSAWGPLGGKRGLSQYLEFVQECCTWPFFCLYHWFGALVAIVFWLTGTYTINADMTDILYWGGPLWVESYVICWLTRGRSMPIATEAMEAITGFAVVPSAYHALKSAGERSFVVTAKGVQRDRVVYHWNILRWTLLAMGLQLAGLVLAFTAHGSEIRGNQLFGFMLLYSTQTMLMFVMMTLVCIELPNRRSDDRFASSEQVELRTAHGKLAARVADISMQGVSLLLSEDLAALELALPLGVVVQGVGEVPARIVRRSRQTLGLALELSSEQRSRMIRKLYCSDDYVRAQHAWNPWIFLRALSTRLFA